MIDFRAILRPLLDFVEVAVRMERVVGLSDQSFIAACHAMAPILFGPRASPPRRRRRQLRVAHRVLNVAIPWAAVLCKEAVLSPAFNPWTG